MSRRCRMQGPKRRARYTQSRLFLRGETWWRQLNRVGRAELPSSQIFCLTVEFYNIISG